MQLFAMEAERKDVQGRVREWHISEEQPRVTPPADFAANEEACIEGVKLDGVQTAKALSEQYGGQEGDVRKKCVAGEGDPPSPSGDGEAGSVET